MPTKIQATTHKAVCKATAKGLKSPKSGRPRKPRALTARQECFCIEYARTKNAYRSYLECFDVKETADRKGVDCRASLLRNKPKIEARINELIEHERRMSDVSLESVTGMVLEDRSLARELGQSSAAVAASRTIAEMHGIMKGGGASGVQVVINLYGAKGNPDASAIASAAVVVEQEGDTAGLLRKREGESSVEGEESESGSEAPGGMVGDAARSVCKE